MVNLYTQSLNLLLILTVSISAIGLIMIIIKLKSDYWFQTALSFFFEVPRIRIPFTLTFLFFLASTTLIELICLYRLAINYPQFIIVQIIIILAFLCACLLPLVPFSSNHTVHYFLAGMYAVLSFVCIVASMFLLDSINLNNSHVTFAMFIILIGAFGLIIDHIIADHYLTIFEFIVIIGILLYCFGLIFASANILL